VRTLEVRRHSFTKKGDDRGSGSHLSAEGVRAARAVGETIGPFAYVVASVVPRTVETAIAMGNAVDACMDQGGGPLWEASLEEVPFHAQWEAAEPFVMYADAIARGGAMRDLAQLQIEIWTNALDHVADGEAVLVVTHGGLIDSGLVRASPDADHASWGRPISQLEGARLTFDGTSLALGEIRRFDP
jgi:broad specificity phosphatase PhoE